jgi:hypothetical protein
LTADSRHLIGITDIFFNEIRFINKFFHAILS